MIDQIDVQGSDGWWLNRAWVKLSSPERLRRLERLDAYRRNEPPLPEGMQQLKEVVQDFLRTSRTNFADMIAEAPRQRMRLVGIRTGVEDGEAGDQVAWSTWTRAGGQVELPEILGNMLGLSDGYAIVGFDDDRNRALLTAEDPRQVVTFHDPRMQGVVKAAAKFFHDPEDGRDYGYLYLPGRVRVAVSDRSSTAGRLAFSPSTWSWSDVVDAEPLGGPLRDDMADVVPVVRFRNYRGIGEFERHTDLLDRINRMVLRRMVIATFQAFKQRAIQGDLPRTDEEGNEIEWDKLLEAGPDALWLLPADVVIWESGQVDLSGILAAVKADLLMLSAVTGTPLSMFTPDAAAQTAEGASLQREALTFKTEDRITIADSRVAEVLSLMLRFAGDAVRGDVDKLQPLWAPVERYSLAEQGSAWSQFTDLPFETKLRTILRFSPDEVARAKTERQDEMLQAAIVAAKTVTPAAAPQAPAPPVTPPATQLAV